MPIGHCRRLIVWVIYDGCRVDPLSLRAHARRSWRLLRFRPLQHLNKVLLGLLRLCTVTLGCKSNNVTPCCKAVDNDRLGPIFEIANTKLALEIQTPRVKVTILGQRHRMLGATRHLFEFDTRFLLIWRSADRWQDIENAALSLLARTTCILGATSDSELAIGIRPTRGYIQSICEKECMILTTGNIYIVFGGILAWAWATPTVHLGRIDALNRVIGVTKLALGCKPPRSGKVLLLILLLLSCIAVQVLLRHLMLLLLHLYLFRYSFKYRKQPNTFKIQIS